MAHGSGGMDDLLHFCQDFPSVNAKFQFSAGGTGTRGAATGGQSASAGKRQGKASSTPKKPKAPVATPTKPKTPVPKKCQKSPSSGEK
eukprot:144128-Pyramimonas_sp.AAC.1